MKKDYRVALLIFYLRKSAQLSIGATIIGTFLPITFIVSSLTFLNLERAVFNIMGGIRSTSHDMAYLVLLLITGLSTILFIPLLIAYIVICVKSSRQELIK